MKKLLALFLAACMLATAGCSNSGGGTSQAGSTDPEGGSSAQSQEGEDGVKLTMSYWGSTVEAVSYTHLQHQVPNFIQLYFTLNFFISVMIKMFFRARIITVAASEINL